MFASSPVDLFTSSGHCNDPSSTPSSAESGLATLSSIPSTALTAAGVSTWEHLPLEVLEKIFLLCLPFDKGQTPCITNAPYLLTCVCQAWYRIVTELPRMWSTVVLRTKNRTEIPSDQQKIGIDYFKLCLSRAKATPITLFICAEFMANNACHELFERIASQISHLTLIYHFPEGIVQVHNPYFPQDHFVDLPNLEVLEVQNHSPSGRTHGSDHLHFSHFALSSKMLRRVVIFDRTITRRPGPGVLHNTHNLRFLSMSEPFPLSISLFVLRNTPVLESLSIKVTDQNWKLNRSVEMVNEDLFQPFTHHRLNHLAITHLRTDLVRFFGTITLPSLEALIVDFAQIRQRPAYPWPQDIFMDFLRRSNCPLQTFQLLDQKIPSSQLIQLLRFPTINHFLNYLGIQTYDGSHLVLDDYLLEELTIPSEPPHDDTSDDPKAAADGHDGILCPNLERMVLFAPLEHFSLVKLLSMFESRLPSSGQSEVYRAVSHRYLKHVEMDIYDEMGSEFEQLQEKGLLFTWFQPELATPLPADERQLELWRRYLAKGLDDEVYEHNTATWRPAEMTFKVERGTTVYYPDQ